MVLRSDMYALVVCQAMLFACAMSRGLLFCWDVQQRACHNVLQNALSAQRSTNTQLPKEFATQETHRVLSSSQGASVLHYIRLAAVHGS